MTAVNDPYAVLGRGYASRRQPDLRVLAAITGALADARSVVNVGAGAGAYEPTDRGVVAVEPSRRMIGQRPAGAAPVIEGYAEHLPFADQRFDVGMAVLTAHHWADPAAGFAELRRVSRRQVVLTWDPAITAKFWLVADYFPEVAEHERTLFCLAEVRAALAIGGDRVEEYPVPVPHDCSDGFLGAYWRRPELYLDPVARAAMSGLALIDHRAGIARLSADLADGSWRRRNRRLLGLDRLDLGYRLVVTGP